MQVAVDKTSGPWKESLSVINKGLQTRQFGSLFHPLPQRQSREFNFPLQPQVRDLLALVHQLGLVASHHTLNDAFGPRIKTTVGMFG